MFVFAQDAVQHATVDLLDAPRDFQGVFIRDPRQNLVLVLQVA